CASTLLIAGQHVTGEISVDEIAEIALIDGLLTRSEKRFLVLYFHGGCRSDGQRLCHVPGMRQGLVGDHSSGQTEIGGEGQAGCRKDNGCQQNRGPEPKSEDTAIVFFNNRAQTCSPGAASAGRSRRSGASSALSRAECGTACPDTHYNIE